jgi:predicted cobalt transporter CbtA
LTSLNTSKKIMAKQPQRPYQPQQRKSAPAPVRRPSEKKESIFSAGDRTLIFGRQNFILMGIGLALVLAGLAAMSGGAMPDPNKWEPERIYSPMRITVAPVLMVAGFVTVIFGIFKRKPDPVDATNHPEA